MKNLNDKYKEIENMKLNYNVKKLIRLIKALPIAVAIIFSLTTTYLVVNNSIEKHHESIEKIKSNFISEEKIVLKKEVLRTLDQINYQKNLAEENLKKDVKKRVLMVYKIIDNIYKENKDKSKEQISKMIKDAIRTIRFFDGRGYFFIYTMDGTNVLFPTSPHLEGENMWNLKDAKGGYSIRLLANVSKTKGEGFSSWYWFKPSDNKSLEKKMYKKIGYTKYIKELDWFVGAGEYVEEFEHKVQQNLIKEIQQIRFGKNGYIFMHQYDGVCLSHIEKELIGTNRLNIQDDDGIYPVKNMIKIAQKGGGYVKNANSINPTTLESSDKLSYIVGMNDWKWQIGAHTNMSDINAILEKQEKEFDEKLKDTIIKIIVASIFITLLVLYAMVRVLSIIEKEFTKYEEALGIHISEIHKKDQLLSEQSKLAAMGEMIANIAHQWRQPLSVISTAATGMKLQKEYGCLPDNVFNNSCDAINNNAQYLSDTIEDFKNFIKGDHIKKSFNLTKTIESFLHLIDSSIKSNNIDIVLDMDEKIVLDSYENELVQCFMNLFNNSKDALIEKIKNNRKFSITTYKSEESAIIEIRDNAGGIKEDILEKIFEPYFTTKHQSQGTGLGLHMTYNLIIEGMKGTIIVQNDKEFGGALFTISLSLK